MKDYLTFLIVDNDTDDRKFFRDAIEEIYPGSVCHVANHGNDCLTLLRKTKTVLPDLIFLDLNMPIMDGKECLAELKKDDGLKNIPVIIYTTSHSQKEREETHELGAAHYLVKPISFKGICEGIKGAIETVGID